MTADIIETGHLTPDERSRRTLFSREFNANYERFRQLALSNARNISLHRAGYPTSVQVHIIGLFGVAYSGNPVERVPLTEDDPARPSRAVGSYAITNTASSAARRLSDRRETSIR
jgi:hypothetical protein